jgi:hypothetical protein
MSLTALLFEGYDEVTPVDRTARTVPLSPLLSHPREGTHGRKANKPWIRHESLWTLRHKVEDQSDIYVCEQGHRLPSVSTCDSVGISTITRSRNGHHFMSPMTR